MSGMWFLLYGAASILSAVAAYFTAERKGRRVPTWTFLCFLFYPLIIILTLLPNRSEGDTKRRGFVIPLQVTGSVYAVGLFSYAIWTLVQAGSASGFPQCGSETAHDAATRAFAEAPLGKLMGLKIIDFQDDQQTSSSEEKIECTSNITLNNGNVIPATYNIERRGNKFFVFIQIQPVGESPPPDQPPGV